MEVTTNENDKFLVELNEETKQIQVKTNDSKTLAEGHFAVDTPDRSALILFHHVSIPPNNTDELSQFLSTVKNHVGRLYKAFVCIRLPGIYDGRVDLTLMKNRNSILNLMAVTLDHLNYFPENNILEQFALISDKELIVQSAEKIQKLMNQEAYWARFWKLDETINRINSATNPAMIIDKITNTVSAFGRLFFLQTNAEIFCYFSDIAVDSNYQSKGVGRMLFNYFVGLCSNQDLKQRGVTGTLYLQCADQGPGAISAPKLYKRSGFENIQEIDNRIAIFATTEFYVRPSTE